ncbi:hypothetical protein ASPNIDRAFT_37234 [Aspergillus niger ATCC 1015]|uniref:Uncharacterized protein n=2 Tax=Aspergillus niger TaxID=5061 RepID=G3Y0U2_ASPNA|nr:uncharacterized protein BO96DRAFT_219717 [Aspergillus niger CBS 101883]EHA23216.1 hypothetical protein ASPNIDRAFT_37234 [Aspergillus niger ATCC 1015]PYH50733.1 hypothetical protein BO96DRAFT_219717 [Aspergillus niger CBS 101883]RDH19927.1 hypothetical protein M747DRAFT_295956 [Aspergillus niger ATCC 13496]
MDQAGHSCFSFQGPVHYIACLVFIAHFWLLVLLLLQTDSLRPGKARRAVGPCYYFFWGEMGGKTKRWALDTGGLCWKARVMPVTVSLGLSRFSSDQPLWRPRRVGGVWASG